MTLRAKDLLQDFTPEARAEAPEAAAGTPALFAVDGLTAVILVELLDALDAVSGLLEAETAAVSRGDLGGLERFAQDKLKMVQTLEGLTVHLRADAVRLDRDLRAMVLARVERLDRAVAGNTASLVATRRAVLAINRSLMTALERAASDGLYAPSGQAVRPVELSVAGINAEL